LGLFYQKKKKKKEAFLCVRCGFEIGWDELDTLDLVGWNVRTKYSARKEEERRDERRGVDTAYGH